MRIFYFVIVWLTVIKIDGSELNKQPNIGWNDVSFHGSPQIPTPNLDALAFSGVMLQNYYVTPLCTPSRSALMTGKHPTHTGMQSEVIYGYSRYGLPLSEKTLPEYLRSLGYKNHIVGKWHLGHFRERYTPLFRGFDSHYGYWTGHQDYYDHTAMEWHAWGYDMRRNLSVDWSAFGKYSTSLFTEEACNVIANHDTLSSPFFLYVAHLAVHSANPYAPLQAPLETVERFSSISDLQRRRYAAMVHELDNSVGTIVKALEEKNILNNTIIIFSSDNGGPAAGFNQNAASNWPLKGVKNTPWEGGVRAVGLLWSPLITESKRGRIMSNLMDISDWVPTLYEAAGGKVADLKSLDGISHWQSIIDDVPCSRKHLLHNIDDTQGYAALRSGNWKLVKGTTYNGDWDKWYGPSGREPELSSNKINIYPFRNELKKSEVAQVMTKIGIKLPSHLHELWKNAQILCGKRSPGATDCAPLEAPCLFNIANDPCEYDNLAEKYPEVVRSMLNLLDWYNSTAVEPLNTSPDPMSNPKYWGYAYVNWVDYIEPLE